VYQIYRETEFFFFKFIDSRGDIHHKIGMIYICMYVYISKIIFCVVYIYREGIYFSKRFNQSIKI
jgi:hypothetical protein